MKAPLKYFLLILGAIVFAQRLQDDVLLELQPDDVAFRVVRQTGHGVPRAWIGAGFPES